jgi:hypothetical protein
LTQFNQQQAETDRLQRKADGEKDVALKRQYQADADRAGRTSGDTKYQLNTISNQINAAKMERIRIDRDRVALGGTALMQGQELENMRRGLEHERLRNENKQKRADKAKHIGGKAAALGSQIHAFSTYDEFPFEELRSTLLSNLR